MIPLSLPEARRIALDAVGLARTRAAQRGPVALSAMIERLGQVQIDSVNVLARAHYLPGFSRLGAYRAADLDRMARGPKRRLFEYWGHEAALIDVALQPALRWRMARARGGAGKSIAAFAAERRPYIDAVLDEVVRRGPLAARDLAGGGKASGAWWGWSEGKRALEWLFLAGLVTTHSRRGFERVYDLVERVMPELAALPTPGEEEGQRTLLLRAARALGVATTGDLRAYWRIAPRDAAARIAELAEEGLILPARVEGWRQPAWIAAERAGAPLRRSRAAALVSPFDPLLWERDRAERLLGFRYRIEIYTPAHLREHGYYVLPFLVRGRIAARLDLKADRARRTLLVQAAHLEPGAERDETAEAVRAELEEMRGWLGLEGVEVMGKGDLAGAIA